MSRSYDLLVKAKGDSKDAQRALRDLQRASRRFTDGFGRHMKSAAKWGAIGLGAGLAATVREGVLEMAEAAKVSAQTGAVIRSTGGAAGLSVKQFESLAMALSKVSGVDDEVIQGGENIIATFTKIKDGAFKGATQAALDMSVALGEDMTSSAMRIGKALQDPIKGVTSLRRAGVMLTASQTDQIKAFVKSGDVMKAQKIILHELGTEFGGSAKAFGKTGPGELAKAKNAFDELAASLVGRVAPSMASVASEATQLVESIDRWAHTKEGAAALDQARYSAGQLGAVLRTVAGASVDLAAGFGEMSRTLLPLAGGIAGAVVGYRAYEAALDGARAAQLALNVASKGNPIGLAVGAAAALATAFLTTKLRMDDSEKAINRNVDALKKLRAEAMSQAELELAMDSGNVALKRATVEYQRAGAAVQNAKKGTKEYRDALLNQREALIGVRSAELGASRATGDYHQNLSRSKKAASEAITSHKSLLAEKRKLSGQMLQSKQEFLASSRSLYDVSAASTAYERHMHDLRRELARVNGEMKSSSAAAKEAAGKYDLLTGKVLAGGRGFAKARRQMAALADAANAFSSAVRNMPDSKTFTMKVVRTATGIGSHGGLPSQDFTYPKAPPTAVGGVFRSAQVRLIGEAGPEAVVPLSPNRAEDRARVMRQAGLSGGSGGLTQIFNVTNPVEDLAVFMRRAAWEAK